MMNEYVKKERQNKKDPKINMHIKLEGKNQKRT